MDHAVGALLVVAGAVSIPLGLVHQLIEGSCVALAEQVAGLLPAENCAGRMAPRRAMVALVTGEKIEEQARLAERPFVFACSALEYVAEQLLGLATIEKVVLVGRTRVCIPRRPRDAIDPYPHHGIKERRHTVGLRRVEQSAVDVD